MSNVPNANFKNVPLHNKLHADSVLQIHDRRNPSLTFIFRSPLSLCMLQTTLFDISQHPDWYTESQLLHAYSEHLFLRVFKLVLLKHSNFQLNFSFTIIMNEHLGRAFNKSCLVSGLWGISWFRKKKAVESDLNPWPTFY